MLRYRVLYGLRLWNLLNRKVIDMSIEIINSFLGDDKEWKCETPDKCRIHQTGPSMTTLMHYPTILDGHGNNINPDRNKTSCEGECSTCGKVFQ